MFDPIKIRRSKRLLGLEQGRATTVTMIRDRRTASKENSCINSQDGHNIREGFLYNKKVRHG